MRKNKRLRDPVDLKLGNGNLVSAPRVRDYAREYCAYFGSRLSLQPFEMRGLLVSLTAK